MSPYIPAMRDPTAELAGTRRARLAPPESLEGRTIALLDIGKMRGDELIDRLADGLMARGHRIRRYRKPTNTRVAPPEVIQAIASESQVVVIALSD